MKYAVTLSRSAAVALSFLALGVTLWRGLEQPRVALAFGIVIAVGEAVRVRLPGGDPDGNATTSAPLGAAGALGYALLGEVGGQDTSHGPLQCVAVVIVAALAGIAPHAARGATITTDEAVRGVLAVGFAAACF
jgi:hypothetical protein